MSKSSGFGQPKRLATFPRFPRLPGLSTAGATQVLEVVGEPGAPTDPDPPGYLRVRVGKQTIRVALLDAVKWVRPDVARAIAPDLLNRMTALDKLALAHDALSRIGVVESVAALDNGYLRVGYATHDGNGRPVSRTVTIQTEQLYGALSPALGPTDSRAPSVLVGRTFRRSPPKVAS